jgi:formyl-CoA transferase
MLAPTLLSDGTVAPLVAPPVKFSRTPTRIRSAAPVAGADTAEVLAELAGRPATDETNALRRIS